MRVLAVDDDSVVLRTLQVRIQRVESEDKSTPSTSNLPSCNMTFIEYSILFRISVQVLMHGRFSIVFLFVSDLVLFSLLIGNMQSTTVRVEEMRVKRRDSEQWMAHRLFPESLRDRIRRHEQYRWQETRDVDEESLLRNLPKDLRRDIKRHLCLALLMRVTASTKIGNRMAAKRRIRRTELKHRYEYDSGEIGKHNQIGKSGGHRRLLTSPATPFFVLLFLLTGFFALYWRNRSPSRPTPPVLSVYGRDLVKADVDYLEILNENARVAQNRSLRHFQNPVLAYITPWNSRGYEIAKEFNSKFTHLSPVWYELKSQGKKLFLDGQHNADKGWLSELWKNGKALVLPRVVLEAFPADLLFKKKHWSEAYDIILKECKEMKYDGIVLESWSRWAHYGVLHDPEMRKKALEFIKRLGQAMHSANSARNVSHHLELIYVIPAPRSQKLAEYDFGPHDLLELGDSVDGFSLMTYDFSEPQNPGPNAPLSWIHSSMQLLLGSDNDGVLRGHSRMIFLGINLYGNNFVLSKGSGNGAIMGRDYLSLLEKHKPVIRWDEKSAEHFCIYSHAIFSMLSSIHP